MQYVTLTGRPSRPHASYSRLLGERLNGCRGEVRLNLSLIGDYLTTQKRLGHRPILGRITTSRLFRVGQVGVNGFSITGLIFR